MSDNKNQTIIEREPFLFEEVSAEQWQDELARLAAGEALQLGYVFIEREHDELGQDLIVVYPDEQAALRAINDCALIDSFCEEDCTDCYALDSSEAEARLGPAVIDKHEIFLANCWDALP